MGYKLIDDRNGKVIDGNNASSTKIRNVRGFWLDIENPTAVPEMVGLVGLHVFEQFLRIGSPFIIPCDRHDIATLTNKMAVYVYETVPGGIGIAEKLLEVWQTVAKKGMQIAEKCNCLDGCPRCIHTLTLSGRRGCQTEQESWNGVW